VLVGGPSGGCIPYKESEVKVDYEALVSAGAMMGSGGFVVLGDNDCIVDVVRYFLRFTQDESCGRCVPCRRGTKKILQILDALAEGKGIPAMLDELEKMALYVKSGSLCGLGKSAPNPVLSALRHFRDEFEAHVAGQCPAGRCKALSKRAINDRCIGCTKCAQACAVNAVRSVAYQRHEIDRDKCALCDACMAVCPKKAIEAKPVLHCTCIIDTRAI
jgi:Na+-translocating ferredoxin:NAD+ oxidoreductase RNF subunit RnfB